MKTFIRTIYILLLLCVTSFGVSAETKVIERSAKKTPEWLTGATEGYIVVTVQAPNLAKAQKSALNEISERIIRSVASNVQVSQTVIATETTVNGSVDSRDEFTHKSAINAANLPFLKGISLSNAEDIYWVKLRDKKSGAEYYDYSVKYPFSRIEQKRLTAEFEENDARKVSEYETLESEINAVESVDDIQSAIMRLEALEQYFFDNVRLSQTGSLKKRYKSLYKSVTLNGTPEDDGVIRCYLSLNGRRLKSSLPIKVNSNCATIRDRVSASDGSYIIRYSADDCIDDEENTITASVKVDGRTVSNTFSLNSRGEKEKFSVIPDGRIILTADSIDSETRTISGINIRMSLNNRGTVPFGLKSIELHLPGINVPVVFDNIDGIFTSRGLIQIKARVNGTFTISEKRKSKVAFVNGTVTLANPTSGAIEAIRLSLPYSTNWE